MADRNTQIIKIRIMVNLVLALFKGTVGFLADSLSIILDADISD